MVVYQIYFDKSQEKNLDYIPYYNQDCTLFFENSVIVDLINQKKHVGSGYFGVVSHKLRQKTETTKTAWKNIPEIRNNSTKEFNPEAFESILNKYKPDVMSFQRHSPHDPISFSNKFHPNFSAYFKKVMNEIGYIWTPKLYKNVFYCNYFVAKEEIYEEYVKTMLIPAMEVMNNMPELMKNSNYPHKLPGNLKQKFGVNYYPYHTFICERMFSFYADFKQLNCLHY